MIGFNNDICELDATLAELRERHNNLAYDYAKKEQAVVRLADENAELREQLEQLRRDRTAWAGRALKAERMIKDALRKAAKTT